jgi:hypothetical protein
MQVKAFGINHPRSTCAGEWAEAAPVSGIECLGLVNIMPGLRASGRRESSGTDGGSTARALASSCWRFVDPGRNRMRGGKEETQGFMKVLVSQSDDRILASR